MRRLRSMALVVVATATLLVAGGWWAFQVWLDRPIGPAATGYVLDVAPGTSVQAIARRLAADGVLTRPRLFRLHARLSGQATRVHAGEYELQARLTPRELLRLLVSGKVRLHSLTIVEGWTVRQLLAAIARHPELAHTLSGDDPVELASVLDLAYPHAEGLFFPDTYRFARGTTDRELLLQAYHRMLERLDSAWAQRQPGLPLASRYDALILASIIERETALDRERPLIAGVFIRRLQRNMRLQTDPTVIYGLGERFDGNLTRADLGKDTAYNTYTRPGLPPTPIGLPGEASLQAAVHPAPGDALYFVATGQPDGSHAFSATLEEHNAAVARYLAELRRRRKER